MRKLEDDVLPTQQAIIKLYKRYVDDVYSRKTKQPEDTLLHGLNAYHRNTNFTKEENPSAFLDTAIHRHQDGNITTSVYTKPNKIPTLWTSRVPLKYKKNTLRTELHRAKSISSDFEEETKRITKKYSDAGYPIRFIKSVIKQFNEPPDPEEIPYWLFEDRRTVLIRLPFCESNEKDSKSFIKRLETFTRDKYIFKIIWTTKKIRSLFPLKDKNQHRSSVIYEGTCTCGEKYIGETIRNTDIRWTEHNTPSAKSEPAKHLQNNTTHKFAWKIISSAPRQQNKRELLEALYITKMKPGLNEQIESDILKLFRHGLT